MASLWFYLLDILKRVTSCRPILKTCEKLIYAYKRNFWHHWILLEFVWILHCWFLEEVFEVSLMTARYKRDWLCADLLSLFMHFCKLYSVSTCSLVIQNPLILFKVLSLHRFSLLSNSLSILLTAYWCFRLFILFLFFFNWMRMCYLKFNATVSSIRGCQCDRSVFYLRYDLCGRTVHFWLLWSLTLFFLLIWFMAAGLTLAPLLVKVDPNLNVILTACLTVYVGCYRSVKPTPPSVSTAGIDAPQPFLLLSPFNLSLFYTLFLYTGDDV